MILSLNKGCKIFFLSCPGYCDRRVLTSGPEDRGSISDRVIPKTQKWYLMPLCLILSIIGYGW